MMKTLHGYDKIVTKGHTSRKNSLWCPHDTKFVQLIKIYNPYIAHFFHLRKFEQNVVQISQVCDIVLESLYEIQEFVTSVW